MEACVRTFTQGARLHLEFKDESTIRQKCKELDRLATKFIRQFTQSIQPHSKGLGKRNVTAAVSSFTSRVNEIAARSKKQLFERELEKEPLQQAESPPPQAIDPPAEVAPRRARGKAIVSLLARVVERQHTTIEDWAHTHRLGRSTVYAWKACCLSGRPLRGEVSRGKALTIEEAIRNDAAELGLITRTNSD